jgi:peroxiredoxin
MKPQLLILALCLLAQSDDKPIQVGANAPAFSLQDQSGRAITLQENLNKFTVLEWFDPECDYTKRDVEAKTTKRLAEKYKEKSVIWLAINSTRDSTPSFNKKWAQTNELPYAILDDANKAVARQYGIKTVPFYVFIDQHGKVVYTGPLDDNEDRTETNREGRINFIDRALDELTRGKPITRPNEKPLGCPLH